MKGYFGHPNNVTNLNPYNIREKTAMTQISKKLEYDAGGFIGAVSFTRAKPFGKLAEDENRDGQFDKLGIDVQIVFVEEID